MEKTKIKKKSKNKEPWEDRHEIIASLVNKNSIKTAVELGVAFGGNSENLLTNTKIKKLYGIDPYKNRWTYNDGMNRQQQELELIYQKTINRLRKFSLRYKHIRKFSKDAISSVPNYVDFVYIDADHSYIGCLTDLRLWVPKVKIGGIIAGDDYNSKTFPGTTKAVRKYFKKLDWEIHTKGSRVWWVKKQKMTKNFALNNHLFLFNPLIRKSHFFLGELYNATLGKLFFKSQNFRNKINHKLRIFIKRILPNSIVIYLKNHYGKR